MSETVPSPDAQRSGPANVPVSDDHLPPLARLRAAIRDVPDFPKPGIVFKDLTPLLADPATLALAVELMANPYRRLHVDLVVGAESRGFIFGTAIAQSLSCGFVPVRKPGKLPRRVHGVEYALEYGRDRLEIHAEDIAAGARVLLVDDLLATGGTMKAAAELLAACGSTIVGATVLIELAFLNGRQVVEPALGPGEGGVSPSVHAVIRYD